MTPRSILATLGGGLGLVAGIVGCAVVAGGVLLALGIAPEVRASDAAPAEAYVPPAELVVAVSLGDAALQAGAVRGSEVVVARGLEIDVARLIQRRLGVRSIRFVNIRPSTRLLTASRPGWDMAIAAIRPSQRSVGTEPSIAYLPAGQAILPRRGLPMPRTIAELRTKLLCGRKGSNGAELITSRVRPTQPPLLAPGDERLVRLVQTGACDAALVDAVTVGRLVAGRGTRFGPIVDRIDADDGLVVAVARDGSVTVADVDRALRRLRADGILGQLARRWLGIDPARLRPLR